MSMDEVKQTTPIMEDFASVIHNRTEAFYMPFTQLDKPMAESKGEETPEATETEKENGLGEKGEENTVEEKKQQQEKEEVKAVEEEQQKSEEEKAEQEEEQQEKEEETTVEEKEDCKEEGKESDHNRKASSEELPRVEIAKVESEKAAVVQIGHSKGEPENSRVVVKSVVKHWQGIFSASEKHASNEDVLRRISDERGSEEDQQSVKRLLQIAKATKKTKTNTMVVREKKRVETIKRAVDFDAMEIVIQDKVAQDKVSALPNEKHEKSAVFLTVTSEWLETAIRFVEQEDKVDILSTKLEPQSNGSMQAYVKATVGLRGAREYHWLVRPDYAKDATSRDVQLINDIGGKMARFVAAKRLKRLLTVPFQPVLYMDGQFAVQDDVSKYKVMSDNTGMDLDHLKVTLRSLAKLHAVSHAYFDQVGQADVNRLQRKHFNPSDTAEMKNASKSALARMFDAVLDSIRSAGPEGNHLANEARTKFADRLYDIYKHAFASSAHGLNVLCHGRLTPKNIHFLYDDNQRPVDAIFSDFQYAFHGNPVTDLHLMLSTSMGPKVEEQADFLMRFVYFEVLAGTLKALGVKFDITYESLHKDIKSKSVFGCLAGSICLVHGNDSLSTEDQRRSSGKRVFHSKLLGQMGNLDSAVYEASSPGNRVRALIEKAVQ